MNSLKKTVLYDRHVELGAKIVQFGGWEMPVSYQHGIVSEHLATRKEAGLFDVSHMGRFQIRGADTVTFLQHVLSSNVEHLNTNEPKAQYTIIPDRNGSAVDDAYLYRFLSNEYLLVVNAANRVKDWNHFQNYLKDFKNIELIDRTEKISMLALQGPKSHEILTGLIQSGKVPEPVRNSLSTATIDNIKVKIGRTGYTGESICFEIFVNSEDCIKLWDILLNRGAKPAGLGARDTLRLEAGLPLYGNELGIDPEGKEIPVMSCHLSRFAVSFSPLKADFVGKTALQRQNMALQKILVRDYSLINDLPRLTKAISIIGRGVARKGVKIFKNEKHVGFITSGTMVPLWMIEEGKLSYRISDRYELRSICLAYIDSDIVENDKLSVEIRGKKVEAVVVSSHLQSKIPRKV
jgi:aminomethyltransferase